MSQRKQQSKLIFIIDDNNPLYTHTHTHCGLSRNFIESEKKTGKKQKKKLNLATKYPHKIIQSVGT